MVTVVELLEEITRLKEVIFEYTHMLSKEIAKIYRLDENRIFTVITNGRITLTHPDNKLFKFQFESKELLLKHLLYLTAMRASKKGLKAITGKINFFEISAIKEDLENGSNKKG